MKHYYLVKIGSFNVLNSVMKKELLMGLFFWCGAVLLVGKKPHKLLQVSVFQSKTPLIFIIIFRTESLGLINIKKSPSSIFVCWSVRLVFL